MDELFAKIRMNSLTRDEQEFIIKIIEANHKTTLMLKKACPEFYEDA
jgi:hypothetical protein